MGKPFYTVYDIETTGLSAACQCEIIEFAGIQLDENLNEVNRLHIYVKPYTKLPKKIVELTGITNEQLAGCENRFKALPKIRQFIGDTISVCHNASFDFGFISTMCVLQGLPVLTEYICTMKSYKAITGEKTAKLYMACEKFGIPLTNAHTAICDTEATAELFKHLMLLDKNEPVSKMFRKTYSENEMFVSTLTNIAVQNPNKKIRETLCKAIVGNDKFNISEAIKMFNAGKDPIQVAEKLNCNSDDVASVFALWLNNQRLPRFIYLEDFSLNRQVSSMIQHSSSLNSLYNLHSEVYKDTAINKGLYNYFWVKIKHSDLQMNRRAMNILFLFEYDLIELIKEFPHIHPNDIVLNFRNFAIEHKESHRAYIAKNLASRSELNEAIEKDRTRFSDTELSEHPELINLAVTCELYEKGFFKI